jgi:hypothetical protein
MQNRKKGERKSKKKREKVGKKIERGRAREREGESEKKKGRDSHVSRDVMKERGSHGRGGGGSGRERKREREEERKRGRDYLGHRPVRTPTAVRTFEHSWESRCRHEETKARNTRNKLLRPRRE